MILSTGMRTDIPAFYSQWFLNRIREGFVCVRNPYYPQQVTKYNLSPETVDCLTFCTKNPLPMLPHLDELSDFRQFWFVTITPYGKETEPNVPEKETIIEAFKSLSARVGKQAIGWRYDPVFYSNGYDFEFHVRQFEKIAAALNGYTDSCVLSFLDLYKKVQRNAPGIYPPDIEEQYKLAQAFAKTARENNITIRSCCEGSRLAPFGIDVSGCQTKAVIERAIGKNLIVKENKSQRGECHCLLGNDIGAYDTCPHLCKYCYANSHPKRVEENRRRHDPDSPFLIGHSQESDIITEARQLSFIDRQATLF